mgnify:CR=1 FL=1
MNSQEMERLNELANVALDAEMRLNQVRHELKNGNIIVAQTHVEHAHRVCHRLENELGGKEI